MKETDLNHIIERSINIRKAYHKLERQHHGSEWSVEEDALAFLTDAGLVGRQIMSQQGRWPSKNTEVELEHKLGECLWWIAVLAARLDLDLKDSVEKFLTKTEKLLEK